MARISPLKSLMIGMIFLSLISGPIATTAVAQTATNAASFYIEPSTAHSLGFEWNVTGDDNRNSKVLVRYREAGVSKWSTGKDFHRIKGERISYGAQFDAPEATPYTAGNLHAGSIMFLKPGTSYEVALALVDPDNTSAGNIVAEKRLRVSTKRIPRPYTFGRRLHVYPASFGGTKQEPFYNDIKSAIFQAQAGDHVTLHGGSYELAGSTRIERSGTRTKPIVIKKAGDGDVSIRTTGTFILTNAKYILFDGLKLTGMGQDGIFTEGVVHGLTVRNCSFETFVIGIRAPHRMSRDFYVVDNIFRGTKGDRNRASFHDMGTDRAMWTAGQGHDFGYNIAERMWDGFSIYSDDASDLFDQKISAIDVYHNRIGNIEDDALEADGAQTNVRFFNNLAYDSHVGLSQQPIFGGPIYFTRNVFYNIVKGLVFKSVSQPAGLLAFHNTAFTPKNTSENQVVGYNFRWSNSHFYNNLFVGEYGHTLRGGAGDPTISKMDYNGYRPGGLPIYWAFFSDPYTWLADRSYTSLADFSKATGYETHGTQNIDFSDFVNIPRLQGDAGDTLPSTIDARLVQNSLAVNAGVSIPNMNDGYRGAAPDMGAYEQGEPIPHYGPRQMY